ncbi:MAG: cysteine dioxygenase family protein, partial [Chloroflexaceae bacterium]|nr:cysteine dioxygenase family protein [Chloroflexaceae bacterium]
MTAALRAFAMQPVLQELVAQVHGAVYQPRATEHVAMQVARVLRPFMGAPGLLSAEQSEPDPNQYRQHMLYLDPQDRFSIVALVWMPGQQTPIHDHIAWCVFGVHQGTEYEVNYRLCHGPEGEYLVPVGGS